MQGDHHGECLHDAEVQLLQAALCCCLSHCRRCHVHMSAGSIAGAMC